MTVQEFKSEYPEYAHLEGDELWNMMEYVVLRGSPGNRVLQQLKPIWKRYKLRYLFYRKVNNFVYSKHASMRCVHCKKDANIGFFMNGKHIHSCGKPWITEKNTNWDYRLWKFRESLNNIFYDVLDFLHIVRSSNSGRYDMFGDEMMFVKQWNVNFTTGKSTVILKPRKWYEHIFIPL
jgi:hypothetical protein